MGFRAKGREFFWDMSSDGAQFFLEGSARGGGPSPLGGGIPQGLSKKPARLIFPPRALPKDDHGLGSRTLRNARPGKGVSQSQSLAKGDRSQFRGRLFPPSRIMGSVPPTCK